MSFQQFEHAINASGPWIAGIDFPFGQAREFVANIGWPLIWPDYVRYMQSLDRRDFRKILEQYRAARPEGSKEHRRATDSSAKSVSPQKLHGVPVGLMFFEGAPRLFRSGVFIPHLQSGDQNRIVVEAYPGVLARRLIGKRSYKSDSKRKQTIEQRQARDDMFRKIAGAACLSDYHLVVEAPASLAEDPTGDSLDALLCAIQAAWSWSQREHRFGAPSFVDPLEGWIADPKVSRLTNGRFGGDEVVVDADGAIPRRIRS